MSHSAGRRQWRSLAERANDPDFLARVAGEFPGLADALARKTDRRRVLKLLGASLALAGLAGCDPGEKDGQIVPAVVAPPDIVPGIANRYTTASLADGTAAGVVVTHQMGRPIKVEGNPGHPASLGATDIFGQAMLLDFYDPDRAGYIQRGGVPSDLAGLSGALAGRRAALAAGRGAGLRVLTGSTTSPTSGAQMAALLALYPEARWHRWDGVSRDAVRQGAVLAYGRPVEIAPRVAAADVILALDSDLLSTAPGHLVHARGFASRRNPLRVPRMSRVYAAEPTPTLVGAAADHRIAFGRGEMLYAVGVLADGILHGGQPEGWLAAVVADLKANPGRALIHAGPDLPAEAHALVHAMNEALGGCGRTFEVFEPAEIDPVDHAASMAGLIADMHAGRVSHLLIAGTNPAFSAAPDFAEGMKRVEFSVALTPAPDETARLATWSVPEAHPFEAWSDARAFDGTASILQPQSLPLYGGLTLPDLLHALGAPSAGGRDAIRATWRDRLDERGWHDALAAGVIAGTASAPAGARLRPEAAGIGLPAVQNGLSLELRPDPNLWDGRHANNAWLQELPRPLTKMTWDNPLLISPGLAASEHLAEGDEVRFGIGDTVVTAPVFVLPGQARDTITALFGYGRRVVGSVGSGTGVDMFPLRGATGAVSIARTGRRVPLAGTDHHDVLDPEAGPKDIVRHVTLAQVTAGIARPHDQEATLYARRTLPGQQWGMSIDLNACIGCNACVVACQAENNIPTVGRDEVLRQREMHWLRIDRYYEGDPAAPASFFQPMLCMHCEEAPCEVVCPVGATVHDDEGLNVMVYNRCVGTRFCSNNCPYKVRRFNYGAYAQEEHRPAVSRNPDVSVRARGVMEKCTFCVQRIAEARIAADKENRPVAEGEVVTACQAACPTRVFTFGDVASGESEVSKRKAGALTYALLEERATHPRVTYETLVRNPNPALSA